MSRDKLKEGQVKALMRNAGINHDAREEFLLQEQTKYVKEDPELQAILSSWGEDPELSNLPGTIYPDNWVLGSLRNLALSSLAKFFDSEPGDLLYPYKTFSNLSGRNVPLATGTSHYVIPEPYKKEFKKHMGALSRLPSRIEGQSVNPGMQFPRSEESMQKSRDYLADQRAGKPQTLKVPVEGAYEEAFPGSPTVPIKWPVEKIWEKEAGLDPAYRFDNDQTLPPEYLITPEQATKWMIKPRDQWDSCMIGGKWDMEDCGPPRDWTGDVCTLEQAQNKDDYCGVASTGWHAWLDYTDKEERSRDDRQKSAAAAVQKGMGTRGLEDLPDEEREIINQRILKNIYGR